MGDRVIPSNIIDQDFYRRARGEADDQFGRQPNIPKNQWLHWRYQQLGGTYRGPKPGKGQSAIAMWNDEEWVDAKHPSEACLRKDAHGKRVYRPCYPTKGPKATPDRKARAVGRANGTLPPTHFADGKKRASNPVAPSSPCSRQAFGHTIGVLRAEGRSREQAIAIALNEKRALCSRWLFVYGWADWTNLEPIVGENARLGYGWAQGRLLRFVGKNALPDMHVSRRKGAQVKGYLVEAADPEMLDQVEKSLGQWWERHGVRVKVAGRRNVVEATTFIPKATSVTWSASDPVVEARARQMLERLRTFEGD